MKKILILLFVYMLTMQAAFAVRTASLTRFLESESANRLIARISPAKLSPQRVAKFTPAQKEAILESSLPQKEGASLMERILDTVAPEKMSETTAYDLYGDWLEQKEIERKREREKIRKEWEDVIVHLKDG